MGSAERQGRSLAGHRCEHQRARGRYALPQAIRPLLFTARPRQLATLIAGLFLFALGVVLGLQSGLGAISWTVFHEGLARHTPLTIGQATIVTSVVMVGASWVAGTPPGLGTLLNMLLVGLFMDLILWSGLIDRPENWPGEWALLVSSIAVLGVATGMYISAGLGAGPRDSFNLALSRRTGWPIGLTRWLLETTVLGIGILLGGSFGVGTILAALLIGPAVGLGFRLFRLEPGGESTGERQIGHTESSEWTRADSSGAEERA
ncbi:hypothetical protein HRbin26_01654 [bacterium HR26]|nr:hypothetical protein HRbin26_01654 [bacterium HR26]